MKGDGTWKQDYDKNEELVKSLRDAQLYLEFIFTNDFSLKVL